MAVLGVVVTLKPQQPNRHKWLLLAFGILALLGIGTGIGQQYLNRRANEGQQNILKDALTEQISKTTNLQSDLYQSHLAQEFMKGQLSSISLIIGKISQSVADPGIKQMASAIEKMSLSSSQTKAATDKQICGRTMVLVKRMQEFEYDRKKELFSHVFPVMEAAKTGKDKNDIYMKFYVQDEYKFRTTLLGEANYLKDELLSRLPPQPKTDQPWRLMAFEGTLAGPSPVADAASYLDSLQRKLCP